MKVDDKTRAANANSANSWQCSDVFFSYEYFDYLHAVDVIWIIRASLTEFVVVVILARITVETKIRASKINNQD